MSFPVRTSRHHSTKTSSRSRKIVIISLILLSLFLLGTVIVLSSVSYWLAIPSSAYLSEDEVVWKPEDAIKPLQYDPMMTVNLSRRQEWEETGESTEGVGADGIMGTGTIAEVWKGLEEVVEDDEDADDEPVDIASDVVVAAADGEAQWDVDGPGSGGYWMKRDWDGHVEGTHDWTRLLNVTAKTGEKIPRLIHQTWKNDRLPEKWRKAWKECREGMPDYDYMLWTDDTAREFVKTHYPGHLHMFDSYEYPIQRADSIRYFVLHHFGGMYMDLDIGCRRRVDPLLQGDWDVILPITKPVGISNDLIFSSKGSAFMDNAIHALPAWDHEWIMNYPTVMFSTGPMFLSGQYAIYSSAHPLTETYLRYDIRILSKSLYGKNIPAASVPHSFFSHFYGSSWHADDAGFVTFLGDWGKKLMYVGAVVIALGVIRLVYLKVTGKQGQQYQLLSILPTSASTVSSASSGNHSGNTTPTSSTSSNTFTSPGLESLNPAHLPSDISSTLRRAGHLILAAPATLLSGDRRSVRRRTGLLYFVPPLFQPGSTSRRPRTASEASQLPLRRSRSRGDRDPGGPGLAGAEHAPPPYERASSDPPLLPAPSSEPNKSAEGLEEVDAFLRDVDGESSMADGKPRDDWEWEKDAQ